jgi:hypothetical protein
MAVYDLEEQEKIATLKAWWDQYGNYVTGAVTVVCVIIIAVQGWRWYSRSQSEKAAVLYGAVSTATAQNNPDKAKDAGTQLLDKYPSSAYAARAALLLAKLAVDKKDNATAKTNLQWVIDRASEDELKQIACRPGMPNDMAGVGRRGTGVRRAGGGSRVGISAPPSLSTAPTATASSWRWRSRSRRRSRSR